MNIKNIIDLITEALSIAKKCNNFEIQEKLYDIQQRVYEMQGEDNLLKQKLEINKNITYDNDSQTFVLASTPKTHYCAVCYGSSGKLIPVIKNDDGTGNSKYKCRICEEI